MRYSTVWLEPIERSFNTGGWLMCQKRSMENEEKTSTKWNTCRSFIQFCGFWATKPFFKKITDIFLFSDKHSNMYIWGQIQLESITMCYFTQHGGATAVCYTSHLLLRLGLNLSGVNSWLGVWTGMMGCVCWQIKPCDGLVPCACWIYLALQACLG